jgi:kynureninase
MTQHAHLPNPTDIRHLDATDPLRHLRDRFELPDGIIYLDGNSLGAAPKAALAAMDVAGKQEWATGLIRSWNSAGWFSLVDRLGEKIGKLIGAEPGETLVCDTTSINIYKALHAGLSLRPNRSVIIAEADSFPTDLYVAEGVAAANPHIGIRLIQADVQSLQGEIDDHVAVLLVNHVDYRTGQLRDLRALTALAHSAGAVVVCDLCHSAGALPVDLNGAGVDLAVGCTYKYLNGGPGAPAFIFAARRHHAELTQPLSGWWGHAAPFAFDQSFTPDPGIRKFLCGTQPILSLRALEAALAIFDDVDLQAMRTKSLALADLFIGLVEATTDGLTLMTPRDPEQRGSQVSFAHDHGYAVMQALIARGVIGDFRAPNIMRFGFTPLYTSYDDVFTAASTLADVLAAETWRDQRFQARGAVT